jgi:hypothetical protein
VTRWTAVPALSVTPADWALGVAVPPLIVSDVPSAFVRLIVWTTPDATVASRQPSIVSATQPT